MSRLAKRNNRNSPPTAAAALPLSRLGAQPDFTAALFEMAAQHALPASLVVAVNARAQTSFGDPLMLSEQVSLDGSDAASGFSDSTFSVDQGATPRVEVSRPLSLTLGGHVFVLSPYVFSAGGWGELVMPTALEQRDIGVRSAGLGVRSDTGITDLGGASLAFEIARKVSTLRSVSDGYRANFSAVLRF